MNWLDLIVKLFDQSFASRWTGNCSGWTKELAIVHVISDILIWIAYMTIPMLLVRLARNRKDLPFSVLFFLFAMFIIGCGFTHLMGAITTFYPYYYMDFWVKAITAAVSVMTAWVLWRMYPRMVSMPNPFTALSIIEKTNKELLSTNNELYLANKVNKELEDFALVAANDLQAPIEQNIVYSRLVREGKIEYLDEIENNNLRINEFIKNLLAFARSGGSKLQVETVAIKGVIDSAVEDLRSIVNKSKAKIIIGTMPVIKCDLVQIYRIFQNLVRNAINNRSDKRPLQIEIESMRIDNYWSFFVCDNGIGVPESLLPSLFTVHKGDKIGSGFGLAICKRLVESHGGYINVKSEVDKGTCFTFTIKDIDV